MDFGVSGQFEKRCIACKHRHPLYTRPSRPSRRSSTRYSPIGSDLEVWRQVESWSHKLLHKLWHKRWKSSMNTIALNAAQCLRAGPARARCTILSGDRLSNTNSYAIRKHFGLHQGQRPVAHSEAVVLQCVQMLQVWSSGENARRDARGEMARKVLEKKLERHCKPATISNSTDSVWTL